MKNFMDFLGKQPPGRLIAMGFATVILLGALALMLPISVREGVEVHFIDALFTSTSAVCVTGLIAIDTADHFTAFGQGVVAALIQIGGLGVTSVGVGLIIAAGRRVSIRKPPAGEGGAECGQLRRHRPPGEGSAPHDSLL